MSHSWVKFVRDFCTVNILVFFIFRVCYKWFVLDSYGKVSQYELYPIIFNYVLIISMFTNQVIGSIKYFEPLGTQFLMTIDVSRSQCYDRVTPYLGKYVTVMSIILIIYSSNCALLFCSILTVKGITHRFCTSWVYKSHFFYRLIH
jgi:hypothetical protein